MFRDVCNSCFVAQTFETKTTKRLPDRTTMLDAATDHILDVGLLDMSLRSLGRAMGVSARMLLYHFGSKEQLVAEVLDRIRQGELEEMDAAMQAVDHEGSPSSLFERSWTQASRPASLRYVQLNAEISVLGLRAPDAFAGWRDRSRNQWTELTGRTLARRFDGGPSPAGLAYVIHTTTHGLLRDLAAGFDPATVEAGRAAFGALLDAADRVDRTDVVFDPRPLPGLSDWINRTGRDLEPDAAAEGLAVTHTTDGPASAAAVRRLADDAADAGAELLAAGAAIAGLRIDHLGPAASASLRAHVTVRVGETTSFLDVTVDSAGQTVALARARLS